VALSGVPVLAGEYTLQFEYRFKAGATVGSSSTKLIVNPDPRSLWKDLPTDPSKPYQKPDTAAQALLNPPCTVLAASRRGRSHAHSGTFRDDDFAVDWFQESGWYLLAVADGAGSAKYSRRGSQIACETVHRLLAEQLRGTAAASITRISESWAADPTSEREKLVRNEFYRVLGGAAIQARKAIEEASTEAKAELRDFNTTLIIVLARPCAAGWFLASFSVGDGGAGLAGTLPETPCLLTTPDGGEFAGQTVFLTMKEALATGDAVLRRLRLSHVPSFSALMVMTDGVSDPKFASDEALASPAPWNALWNEISPILADSTDRAEQAAALLEWLNFWSTGNHDDRTIAILFPPPAS
jgi:hypothetical protein